MDATTTMDAETLTAPAGTMTANRSTRGEYVEAIVRRAMEHPGVILYGDILRAYGERANAREAMTNTLETFAHGNLEAHESRERGSVLELTEGERLKLRRLTTCSMCATGDRTIAYDRMMRELKFESVRELEQFIIDECLSTGIVRGKLDPKNGCFLPQGATTRDVPTSALDELHLGVSRWLEISESMLVSLNERVKYIKSESAKLANQEGEVSASIEETKKALKAEQDTNAQGDTSTIDMDDDGQEGTSTGVKRRR